MQILLYLIPKTQLKYRTLLQTIKKKCKSYNATFFSKSDLETKIIYVSVEKDDLDLQKDKLFDKKIGKRNQRVENAVNDFKVRVRSS